jgi:DNA-binding transcriptional LysR family regulator
MDLRRLKTFVTVAEHGTISRAAQVLHITQPALSRQIRSLEQDVGFELFGRVGRRLTLTPRGEQLLGDCRVLLSHASMLDERARALRRGDLRVLKIAASALTIEALFPDFLHRFAEAFPDVRLTLREADAAEHLDMLERGEAHLAINVINVIQVDDHRFASHILPQFQLMAACAPALDIEPGDSIDIRRVAQHPLLLLDTSYATRNLFDGACRVAGVKPNILLESGAAHALVALAEAGHGVAIVPSILRTDPRRLRIMRVTHRREPLEIALAVLWDKRRTLPRYAEGFSELLDQHIRRVFPILGPTRAAAAEAKTKSSRKTVKT